MRDPNIYNEIVNRYKNTKNLSEKSYLLNLLLESLRKSVIREYKLKGETTFNECIKHLRINNDDEREVKKYFKTLWRLRNRLIHDIFDLETILETIELYAGGVEFDNKVTYLLNIVGVPDTSTEIGLNMLLNTPATIYIPNKKIKLDPYLLIEIMEIRPYNLNKEDKTVTINNTVVGTYVNGEVMLNENESALLKQKYGINIEVEKEW